MKYKFAGYLLAALLVSCVSVDSKEAKQSSINEDMTLQEALELAIEEGGQTLDMVKKTKINKSNETEANAIVEKLLLNSSYSSPELLSAINLYQFTVKKVSPGLFVKLIKADDVNARKFGWELATRFPDEELAKVIDKELTEFLTDGEEEQALLPEMAKAVQANRLVSVYTLVREGLYRKGDDAFARAMAVLNPDQASYDFMDYLAQASSEDLRQIHQSTINPYSAMIILQHYLSYSPPFAHPKFDQLFYYAISRNQGLAQLANMVIERQLSQNQGLMLSKLSSLPVWAQVAYVEGTRKNFTAGVKGFLANLRKSTAHTEVVEEIDSIR
jgi:hypothetical protein